MSVYVYVSYVCMSVYVCVCIIYVCMCVCMCIYVYKLTCAGKDAHVASIPLSDTLERLPSSRPATPQQYVRNPKNLKR